MADIKISELEPTTDLEGLYTIGSDKNNLSKKVSLQFLKDAANYANMQGDYAKEVGDSYGGKLTELECVFVAGRSRMRFSTQDDLSVVITTTGNVSLWSSEGKEYNALTAGTYTIPVNQSMVYDVQDNSTKIGKVNANKGVILAFNEEGKIKQGILSGWYNWSEGIVEKESENQKLSAVKGNIGIIGSIHQVNASVNTDYSVVISITNDIPCYGIDNRYYKIQKGEYVIANNQSLSYNINDGTITTHRVDGNSDNTILLAFNTQGYITSGMLAGFCQYIHSNNSNSYVQSIVNSLMGAFPISQFDGYMDRAGNQVTANMDCLITPWVRVKKGDVLLYKGYGYSDGMSYVVKDLYGGNQTSAAIDSTTQHTEIVMPFDGEARFSTYRVKGANRNLVLDVRYKSNLLRHINKTMVNVGHSIWWLDGTNYDSRNSIDGNGTLCRGFQTLLQEQFSFNGVKKYCYSGYSLGVGTRNQTSSIMGYKADSFEAQDQAVWTLDTLTNDFANSVQLGTPSDYENNTGINTYYGALRAFRDKVLSLSKTPIVICANAFVRTDYEGKPNTIGLNLEDYEKALLYVACRNEWYFVDQYRNSGINELNAPYTLYDMLHPTNFGFRLAVKPWVEQFKIIQNVI